jgi:HPt (histidine-containing phosphotransfer) domain-containing protein
VTKVLEVPGLDVAQGLHFVGGRMATYLTILRMFAEQQADVAGEIRRALDADDPDTAMQVLHTAKGILGTIGAAQLHVDATALYQALREHRPRTDIDPLLKDFEARHDVLVAGVIAQVPAETPR